MAEQLDPQAIEATQTAPEPAQETSVAPVEETPVPAPVPVVAVPVTVNNFTRRSDDDAIEGSFVDVVDGEHKGRFGAFVRALEHHPVTGYPSKILVRSRDEFNELLEVAYEHARPSKRTGGR